MTGDAVRTARAFVDTLELPAAPRSARRFRASSSVLDQVRDQAKDRALVVGSDIISFAAGVNAETRQDIINCSLLAQLAANKRVPEKDNVRAWYDVYFDTLTRIGWVTQERGFSQHREAGQDFEAHRAVLSIAAVLLGPAPAALAVVTATLNAMKEMAEGQWMALFKRESQAARAARFQVTLAAPTPEGSSMIALMAFELEAKAALTQVLFFRLRSSDVTLRHASGKVTIDTDVLTAIRPAIAQKIAVHAASFVEELEI